MTIVLTTLEYLIPAFAGVVARAVVEPCRDIESLRGRNSPFKARESTRQASCRACRDMEGLFESLLAESFHE
jgi:hypothetical protein